VLLVLVSQSASAHSFGQIYTLPLPIWLYLWGAAAALILSFVVVGLFATEDAKIGTETATEIRIATPYRVPAFLLLALRIFSVSGLLLCIATGWFGTASPYGNFNMTFFWVVFLLGFAYATAVIGDLYALINPWQYIGRWMARAFPSYEQGLVRYPASCGYWPALVFYIAMIWIELFGGGQPFTLSLALLAYTGINLLAIGLIGAKDWFQYGEFFSVYFRLIGKMAPVEYLSDSGKISSVMFRLRRPVAGLRQSESTHFSLLIFVLFMLSSTAFDGLHETKPWVRLFWVDLYTQFLVPWVGSNPFVAYVKLREYFVWWQRVWLVLSPLVYLLLYLAGIALVWLVSGRRMSIRSLALRFMFSLLPIALVYHITHYYTLIQTQGLKIIALASDPFGWGHDWLGTAGWFYGSIVPDTNIVWHVQVALIVIGHILGVWLAHLEALRCFGSRRIATISQIPMLLLMLFFTTAGLWILAQPIQAV
jgi:hypothetical protein